MRKLAMYEGVVENGHVTLPPDAQFPKELTFMCWFRMLTHNGLTIWLFFSMVLNLVGRNRRTRRSSLPLLACSSAARIFPQCPDRRGLDAVIEPTHERVSNLP